jgi:hypothetical protein
VKQSIMIAFAIFMALCLGGCFRDTIDLRGSARTCRIHGSPLKEDVVQISYNWIVPVAAGYSQAELSSFPEAHDIEYRGIPLFPCSPHHARVRFCKECRDAKVAWCEQHTDWLVLFLTKAPLFFQKCDDSIRTWRTQEEPWWLTFVI